MNDSVVKLSGAQRARSIDLMTINDAEGIVTAKRYDGHVKWPSDYE